MPSASSSQRASLQAVFSRACRFPPLLLARLLLLLLLRLRKVLIPVMASPLRRQDFLVRWRRPQLPTSPASRTTAALTAGIAAATMRG